MSVNLNEVRDLLKNLKILDKIAGNVTSLNISTSLLSNFNTGGGTDNRFTSGIIVPSSTGAVVAGVLATPFYTGISDGTNKIKPTAAGELNINMNTGVANNQAGTAAIALASGSSSTLVNYTPAGTYNILGMQVMSTNDGTFIMSIGATAFYYAFTNVHVPSLILALPRPHQITGGATAITIVAKNKDTIQSLTGDYYASLLGF